MIKEINKIIYNGQVITYGIANDIRFRLEVNKHYGTYFLVESQLSRMEEMK